MKPDSFINFLGWGLFTFAWLDFNYLFFCAIAEAINEHNEQIREQALDEYMESEDENLLKSIKELVERLKKKVC